MELTGGYGFIVRAISKILDEVLVIIPSEQRKGKFAGKILVRRTPCHEDLTVELLLSNQPSYKC